jgi:hypothetical protein
MSFRSSSLSPFVDRLGECAPSRVARLDEIPVDQPPRRPSQKGA